MKITQSIYQLAFLIILFAAFASYNFMFADAPANPPANNATAPLNVGSIDQIKNGGLSVNSLLVSGNMMVSGQYGTFNQVRALQYCDKNGQNCSVPGVGSAGGSFGGVYIQKTGYTPSCSKVNPVTNACTCPSGTASFTVLLDTYTHYTGEHSGGNVIGATYTNLNICVGAN